jgi:hypothetical protein
MPTTRKPPPCSEPRLPGWACRLAERATREQALAVSGIDPAAGGDDSGPVADRSLDLTPRER